jgi:hypothetical protein
MCRASTRKKKGRHLIRKSPAYYRHLKRGSDAVMESPHNRSVRYMSDRHDGPGRIVCPGGQPVNRILTIGADNVNVVYRIGPGLRFGPVIVGSQADGGLSGSNRDPAEHCAQAGTVIRCPRIGVLEIHRLVGLPREHIGFATRLLETGYSSLRRILMASSARSLAMKRTLPRGRRWRNRTSSWGRAGKERPGAVREEVIPRDGAGRRSAK